MGNWNRCRVRIRARMHAAFSPHKLFRNCATLVVCRRGAHANESCERRVARRIASYSQRRFIVKIIICALTVTSLCAPLAAVAQDKPTPEEARKVINYYFNGKGHGVIPMEYKLCKEVAQKGEMKNECVTEISNKKVAKGEEAYLWMNFLVPAGEESKILLQYSRKNMVRDTSSVSLGGATRYRIWKKIPTSTTGDWKVSLIQEMDNSDVKIGQVEFSVVEAGQ